MSGLFEPHPQDQTLAVRMRPRDLLEFVGQRHLLGEGKILNRALKVGRISSLIFYGPPGTGKTCLALIIKQKLNAHFMRVNAVASNVQEIRDVLRSAKYKLEQEGRKTILFIDEIHRFNKAQQDVLLPDVEMGNPVLIGATTHNPFFALTPPLISRSLICEFKPLSEEDILLILKRALTDKERGLGNYKIKIENKVLRFFAQVSDGDARRALNALEIAVLTTPEDKDGIRKIDLKIAEDSIQKKAVLYDRDEDAHYDTISAFIKSMRGSDPDATLYWLAKMIYAGEDPRFIARRILIAAAEDVGNADPQALVIAQAACYAVEYLGMPEAKIPLAQAAIYVACAPKSNSCYMGIEKALEDVEKGKLLEVSQHLKDSHYKGAEKLGRGKDYKYPHAYKGGWVKQDYLPEKLRYYFPKDSGYERKIKEYLQKLKKL
ncbi:MAG TPA: replication-associated recombination protein A [Candidatus Omnitrophica bacterium]|nr:replication-associated recombination protein A [Candidatus Omnitrophota bacterium]